MSVWFVLPSARDVVAARETLTHWKDMGYKLAVLRQGERLGLCDIEVPTEEYQGWPNSVNHLAKTVIARDPEAEYVVAGGDDQLPDLQYPPSYIAECCNKYFGPSKVGVMQPTGDRYSGDGNGPDIERGAASPWMTREWVRRAYRGKGPLWDKYFHFYGDEELMEVALQLRCYWPNKGFKQEHQHWTRRELALRVMPEYMELPHKYWPVDQGLFEQRRAAGWPGHELLP